VTGEPAEWIANPVAIAEEFEEDSEVETMVVPEIAPIAPRSKREKPAPEPVRQRVADAEVLKLSPEEKAKLRVKMRIAIAVFSAVALLVTFIVLLMLSP
jgi:hypothetical protein